MVQAGFGAGLGITFARTVGGIVFVVYCCWGIVLTLMFCFG